MAVSTVFATAITSSQAAVTVDRLYSLGDYDDGSVAENTQPTAGPTAGDGDPIGSTIAGADALDSLDTGGGFADLMKVGNPLYRQITPGDTSSSHPGAVGSYSIAFNGATDGLFNTDERAASNNGGSQGMQMWALPDNGGSLGSTTQVLALDATNAGNANGVGITDTGNWALLDDGNVVDSGVSVSTIEWTHLATHVYLESDSAAPQPVAGTSGDFTMVLYADGVAIAARTSGTAAPETAIFSAGSAHDGATASAFYDGTLDELSVYTSEADAFDLFADNDFIRAQVESIAGVGNALPLGDVDHNGTLDPVADVNAFVAGWRNQKVVNGLYVGDWETHGWGDLNLDGRVDLSDAFLLHSALAPSGGLDFSLLSAGSSVPEPGAAILVIVAGLLASQQRRFANWR